jgi:ribosomal protein S18 acetylase RimI-like enzyme
LLDAHGALHDVWVEEELREQGIATRLMEAMIARLEGMGAARIVLSTAWQNARAHDLFAKLGFRPTMIEMTRERGGRPEGSEPR